MASSSSPLRSSSVSPLPPSPPTAMKDGEFKNWAELPPELTSSILLRLGATEILENAQRVCRSWLRLCKDPSMWRKIDMLDLDDYDSKDCKASMCRRAIDRSQGGLVEIDIGYFGSDDLLDYIADSSSGLRSLKLVMCNELTDDGFAEVVVKLPLLEELEASYCSLSEESLKAVGKSCPNLKTLKLNCAGYRVPRNESDDEALAIAATMPRLGHLQLFGNRLTDVGLNAILENCPDLEHLDLRQCFNVNLVGDLEKRCLEKIKVVRRPNDSTRDYPYDATINDVDSSDDEYPYGFSDVDLMSDDEYLYDLSGASDHSDDDMFDVYDDLYL
uniref:F-box protein SKIP19 n=1 Tax=Noccaea caerulescens TaxID=107243 RepID=A0A1J3K9A7_NOCCA